MAAMEGKHKILSKQYRAINWNVSMVDAHS